MGQCSNCKLCNEDDSQLLTKIPQNPKMESITVENPLEQVNFSETDKKKFEKEVEQNYLRYANTLHTLYKPPELGRGESSISISKRLFINELYEKPDSKYNIIKGLGSGSFGVVYLAENTITKEQVAIKKINKTSEDLLIDGEITDEIEILKSLDHPDIVRLTEFYSTRDAYYLVSEYCSGGELYDQINKDFSETQIAVMIKQILSGLAYLHSNNIIHRDLKLENLLISEKEISESNGEELFNIKIIDFGTARIFDRSKKADTVVGSVYYIAPEVLNKEYNRECDLWSVGVILYMFIVGHSPFDGNNEKEIVAKIKKGEFPQNEERWKNASEEVKDLIKHLLVIDPKQRLTAVQALKHQWFRTTNSDILYMNISKEQVLERIKSLLSYKIKSKFEELILAYIIHNMPRPFEAKSAIKIFVLANKSGDGKLSRYELKETLLNFVSEEFLKNYDQIFTMLDGDNNEYIDYEEFLRASLDRKSYVTDDVLHIAFDYFDKEKSGFITKEKIKSCMITTKVPNEVFDQIFKEIDANHNNQIDFEEFKKMIIY